MKKNAIRIVGGQYRRTPIPVVDATSLRPTPDRVREMCATVLADGADMVIGDRLSASYFTENKKPFNS